MNKHQIGDLLLAPDKKTLGVIVKVGSVIAHNGTLYAVDWNNIGYAYPYYESDITEWKENLCKFIT